MIYVDQLSYEINGSQLLHDVSVNFQLGQLNVILGPNGAGKSTLIKVISGELERVRGEVSIADVRLDEWSPQRLACRRAVVAQFNQIAFPFTVLEIVMMGLIPSSVYNKNLATENDVHVIMEELEILHLGDRIYSTLSGGEQQRVSIARALVQVLSATKNNESCCLLLDEPTASLDLRHQHELLRLLKQKIKNNYCILMILHDINLALQYADHIAMMKEGKVVKTGAVNNVITGETLNSIFSVRGVLKNVEDGGKRFFILN